MKRGKRRKVSEKPLFFERASDAGKTDRHKQSSATRLAWRSLGKAQPRLSRFGRGDARDAALRPSRATATARARSSPQRGGRDAHARGGGPNFATARLPRRARARRRLSRCLLRRRAATVVPRFRKQARSQSRGAVPSRRAVRVDANVTDDAFARPEQHVPPWKAPSRRRARGILEPATRLAAGRGC